MSSASKNNQKLFSLYTFFFSIWWFDCLPDVPATQMYCTQNRQLVSDPSQPPKGSFLGLGGWGGEGGKSDKNAWHSEWLGWVERRPPHHHHHQPAHLLGLHTPPSLSGGVRKRSDDKNDSLVVCRPRDASLPKRGREGKGKGEARGL